MDRWIDADDDIHARSRTQPQGRVARLGIAGFVKSEGSLGTENAQTFGKIEVVQSKREQRKADASRLMPPPQLPAQAAAAAAAPPSAPEPVVQSIPAATGPPKYPVPSWAAEPPAGSRLLVYKDGQVIQEVGLAKIVTVFGRVDALADVVLDHPSISRQHATAAFHADRAVWMVTDLGSTHGTFVGDRQLAKNEPVELPPGVELRFAASTRRYKLPPPPPPRAGLGFAAGQAAPAKASDGGSRAAGAAVVPATAADPRSSEAMPPPPPPKRARVCFADDIDADGGPGGQGTSGGTGAGRGGVGARSDPAGRPRQLETVIGFSDGRDFVARVGPKAVAPAEGKFAGAVATTIVVSPKPGQGGGVREAAPGAHESGADGAGGGPPQIGSPRGSGGGAGRGALAGGRRGSGGMDGEPGETQAAEVRPTLKDFVDRIRKEPQRGGSGSLYEQLPPPSH